mgnify:CR=1 FL=1
MRFVTAYSLQDAARGPAQIASFQVIPGDKGVGVRLIVNELPYTGPQQAGLLVTGQEQDPLTGPRTRFAPVVPGPQSFILADRLAYCRFSFQEPIPDAPFRRWRPDWTNPQRLPLGIRIEMAPLRTTPGELQVSTITVPVYLTRDTMSIYTDAY